MKLIAQVKLQPTDKQAELLEQTLLAANGAAQHVSDHAWMAKVFKQYDLHHATYDKIREKFNLSAWIGVDMGIVAVDPHDTSQTCSRCGHCEKANRSTRDCFRCVSCGYAVAALQ